MNRKIILLLMVICSIMLFTGCSKDNMNEDNNQNENNNMPNQNSGGTQVRKSTIDAVYNETKIKLKTYSVEFVGNTLNLNVVIANDTKDDKEFDCSKFSVKTYGGETLKVNSAKTITVKANTEYNQLTFTVVDEEKVNVGNLVYGYYDINSLGPTEVSKSS